MRAEDLVSGSAEIARCGRCRRVSRAAFLALLAWSLRAAPIQPLVVTEPVFFDSDDPAIWINRGDPKRSLVLGTCKHPENGGLYVFDLEGKIIREKTILGLKRPNNVDLAYDFELGGKKVDLAVVTERDAGKLRVFTVPDMRAIDGGGLPVFEGDANPLPMGIALYTRPRDGALFVIVSRSTGPSEVVGYGDAEVEQLYPSMATPYDRAPGVTLMFAKRFVPDRKADPAWPNPGLSEIVLLTSRDGLRFDRTFMEPFLPPGLDPDNWHDRAIMLGRGVLPTAPTELSLYYVEHYHLDSVRVRRATLRPDGFASVHAPWAGGEFTTKPLRFDGSELALNYSTSAAGSIRVEIQDEHGKPIPGYRLEDGAEIFGDELDRVVAWRKGHSDVLTPDRQEIPYRPSDIARALGGKTIRLRFVMKAAHLYAFRFK